MNKYSIVRVMCLEDRVVLSVITYTNYTVGIINPDGSSGTGTATFSWDLTNMSYAMALSSVSSCNTANNGVMLAVQAANNAIGSDGSIPDLDTQWLEGAIDACDGAGGNNDQFFGSIGNFAQGAMSGYTNPTVTMDSSVVSVATAQARAKALLGSANTIGVRNAAILADINSTNSTIDQVCKTLYYSSEVSNNSKSLKAISTELKLIKAAYPAAFK